MEMLSGKKRRFTSLICRNIRLSQIKYLSRPTNANDRFVRGIMIGFTNSLVYWQNWNSLPIGFVSTAFPPAGSVGLPPSSLVAYPARSSEPVMPHHLAREPRFSDRAGDGDGWRVARPVTS